MMYQDRRNGLKYFTSRHIKSNNIFILHEICGRVNFSVMKSIFSILVVFMLQTFHYAFAQMEPTNQDEAEIITTFANFKIGIEAKKPELVIKNLDKQTRQFFEKLYDKALHDDSLSIMKSPITELIFLIQIRNSAYDRLSKTNNLNDFYSLMMDIGLLKEDRALEIIIIEIDSNVAVCNLARESVPVKTKYFFKKEDDFWKIDLNTPFEIANERFNELLRDEEKMKSFNVDYMQLYQQILDKNAVPYGASRMWKPVRTKTKTGE
jgi:hypothetical protein